MVYPAAQCANGSQRLGQRIRGHRRRRDLGDHRSRVCRAPDWHRATHRKEPQPILCRVLNSMNRKADWRRNRQQQKRQRSVKRGDAAGVGARYSPLPLFLSLFLTRVLALILSRRTSHFLSFPESFLLFPCTSLSRSASLALSFSLFHWLKIATENRGPFYIVPGSPVTSWRRWRKYLWISSGFSLSWDSVATARGSSR